MLNGIDISSYQKFTTYDGLNDTNHAFAFIKASERLSRNPNYQGHYDSLSKTKLLTGAYHFFRFDANANGVSQANTFLTAIGGKLNSFDLPPVLDVEDDSERMSPLQCVAEVTSWIATVKAALPNTPKIIIYTGNWYWADPNRMNNATNFSNELLWVAKYSNSYLPLFGGWKGPDFWQYTDQGTLPGLNGKVDLNHFMSGINDLWKLLPATTPSDYSMLGAKTWALQYILKKLNHYTGNLDGAWGPKTQAAVSAWQVAHGYAVNNVFDPQQWQALFNLMPGEQPIAAPVRPGSIALSGQGIVLADKLNIRAAAGATNPMVAAPLPKGTGVTVLDEKDGWYKVKTEVEGWVSKNYIQLK